MAKVTKKMLKSVVKECLVEILSEGLGDDDTGVLVETTSRRHNKKKSTKRSIYDQMDEAFEKTPAGTDHVTFSDRANQAAKAATSDPILQSILADTAKTTLQEQYQHETQSPQSLMSSDIQTAAPDSLVGGGTAGIDISSLFGEATKNWGELLERSTAGPL
tara:strand:+ start:19226 stop:19708 length:483 start_codon:yes stop_codon:yes gene_type:complete